jgi:hypothetical protein
VGPLPSVVAVALALLFFCSGCPRSSTSAPPPLSSTVVPPLPPPLPPDVLFEHAGYGGVGPAMPPPQPNPSWTVAFFTLTAKAPMSGLRVEAITLIDAAGVVVARAVAPIEIGSVPGGPLDLSAQGTPFPGSLAAGATVRLKSHAKLDASSEQLYKVPPGVRARIELVDAGGGHFTVEGPAAPWPTG